MREIVWLTDARTFGYLVEMGAFYSKIEYIKDGEKIIDIIGNDEWESYEKHVHDYETD